MPRSLKVAQHDAVVAAEFDDERIGAAIEHLADDEIGVALEMRLHVARRARIERVVLVEHLVRVWLFHDLKHLHASQKAGASSKKYSLATSLCLRNPLAIGMRPNVMKASMGPPQTRHCVESL